MEGTIDEIMQEVLTEKQIIIDTVVDGKLIDGIRGKSVFKEVVKKMLQSRLSGEKFDVDSVSDYETG